MLRVIGRGRTNGATPLKRSPQLSLTCPASQMDLTELVSGWTKTEINDWNSLSHLAEQRYSSGLDLPSYGAVPNRRPAFNELITTRLRPDAPDSTLVSLPGVCWRVAPYMIRRRADIGSLPVTFDEDLDSWIYNSERYLDTAPGFAWSDSGLVSLEDFVSAFSDVGTASGMRFVPRRLPRDGYRLFGPENSDAGISVQESSTSFARAFDELSGGLLRDLDWSNVCVAGGFILETLLHKRGSGPDAHLLIFPPSDSDIDIFLYGLDPKAALEAIAHIYLTLRRNLPVDSEMVTIRSTKAITFYSPYPTRRVQVVLGVGRTRRAILSAFDLDVCAMLWDGETMYMLPRAARALETGSNVFRVEMLSGRFQNAPTTSSIDRVLKYYSRGYPLRILQVYLDVLPSANRLHSIADRQNAIVDKRQAAHNRQHRRRPCPLPYWRLGVADGLRSFATLCQYERLWEIRSGYASSARSANDGLPFKSDSLYYDGSFSFPWGSGITISDLKKSVAALISGRQDASLAAISNYHRATSGASAFSTLPDDVAAVVLSCRSISMDDGPSSLATIFADVSFAILIPDQIAAFANDVITRIQVDQGLTISTTVTRISTEREGHPSAGGLQPHVWTIPATLMLWRWDKRLDGIYYILAIFRSMTQRLQNPEWERPQRWVFSQLVKPLGLLTPERRKELFVQWVDRAERDDDESFYTKQELKEIENV